jgi:phosphoribosylamine--glycine ligase
MNLIQPTRILVVGSGGREHALAWKLAGEPGVNEVFVNPGSDAIAELDRVAVVGHDWLADPTGLTLARRLSVELVVIGPEAVLASGVVDALTEAGIPVFGPRRAAAEIELSKAFCREVADAAGVPMAGGAFFQGPLDAADYARRLADAPGSTGVVVKENGLAAGKGVTVCDTTDQAEAALARAAGEKASVVVEQRLVGREASVIALCDGRDALALPAARDHKRALDGDRGENTGGMGAYSPLPDLSDTEVEDIIERVHRPVLAELARRGRPFRGALYAGLMLTAAGPRLLEFNARFGDPETQVILPRLAAPLGPLLLAAARGRLGGMPTLLPTTPGATLGVVLAGGEYPQRPTEGERIDGLEAAAAAGAVVFHSGTRRAADGTWTTSGGRILTVVGRGPDVGGAKQAAEAAADLISWPGARRRHDIGADAIPVGAAS